MSDSNILEVNLQIEQLKKSNPEIYGWMILKEKHEFLEKELSSEDPERNCDENKKEFDYTKNCMSLMKKNYSSIMLYEALIHLQERAKESSDNAHDK